MHDGGFSSAGRKLASVTNVLFGTLAAVALFFLMLMTVIDVCGRYFFGTPVGAAFELTELLMAVTIFTALPLVTVRSEHITIDLFDHFLPIRAAVFQGIVVSAFCAICLGALSWRLWLKADQLGSYGDHTLVLQLPLAPFVYGMSVMTALAAVFQIVPLISAVPKQGASL